MEKRWPGPTNPPGVTREAVRALHAKGLSRSQIAARLGVNKSTVTFHIGRLHLPVDDRFGRRYDWAAIRTAYDSGLSARQCRERFGFSRDAWDKAVKRGAIVLRPRAMPLEKLLVLGRRTSRNHLKTRLVRSRLKQNRCEQCGIIEWKGKPLNMALHHVNGDGTDNRLENLRFLCPNCHSQTENYGGRNGHRRRGAGGRDGTSAEPRPSAATSATVDAAGA
jgi:hypothetical protein